MVRQYIGARYVTKVYENSQNPGSAEWESGATYEPLTLVTYLNGSYLSKKEVPATVGNPVDNPSYWVVTGAYNGQIAQLQGEIDLINNNINDINNRFLFVTPQDFGAVGDGTTDDTTAIQSALNTGKAIYIPEGTYKVTNTLTYGGALIYGVGTIKFDENLEKGLNCTDGDNIEIFGIKLNGANKCAILLAIENYTSAHVHHVTASNTNNAGLTGNRTCAGINVVADSAEVNNCIVRDINRTKTNDGVISSCGICTYANMSEIHDNYIDTVKCSAQYRDCDGIYVTNGTVGVGVAKVYNNIIYDCTGRFIKSQVSLTTVNNNECRIKTDFSPTETFFAIDIQYGDGEVSNNTIDLKTTYTRTTGYCIGLQTTNDKPHASITIRNNYITGINTPDNHARCILRVSSQANANNEFVANIENNYVDLYLEQYAFIMTGTSAPTGVINIINNIANIIQTAFASTGDLSGILFNVQYNKSIRQGYKTDIFSTATPFDMLICKNNINFEVSVCSALNFNDIKIADFVHNGAVAHISNLPTGITGNIVKVIKDESYYEVIDLDANAPQGIYCGVVS